jgi:8-oxo-dGTP pyrophosphatase MutT (NUDIX family)
MANRKEADVEICDVVNQLGDRTGRVVPRGTELGRGEYYLVVHVWIRDETDNLLIQRRAAHLVSGPGVWATTVGYVRAGEESIAGAIREVHEELGIQLFPTQLRLLYRHTMDDRVEDIWLAEVLQDQIGKPSLGPEVAEWQWISRIELERMANRGDFFKYSYLGDIFK